MRKESDGLYLNNWILILMFNVKSTIMNKVLIFYYKTIYLIFNDYSQVYDDIRHLFFILIKNVTFVKFWNYYLVSNDLGLNACI